MDKKEAVAYSGIFVLVHTYMSIWPVVSWVAPLFQVYRKKQCCSDDSIFKLKFPWCQTAVSVDDNLA